MTKFCIVVPWHRTEEVESFREAWAIPDAEPDFLILQHDKDGEGCAVTKNRGINRAMVRSTEVVVVLDGDCYPTEEASTLEALAELHIKALEPQRVKMFDVVTNPPSRGTPYGDLTMEMPVAASMGFWTEVGDYCASRQLAFDGAPMEFKRETIFGRYFPLCGMNLAFRPGDWHPWNQFINVDRFDDIWQGWLWQKEAYRRGFCFNLNGPLIRHSRQSNVWNNLRLEAKHIESNETLWRRIAEDRSFDYAKLRSLLPVV